MNRNTTLGELLKYLDAQIEAHRRAKFAIEALLHPPSGPTDPDLPPTPPASAVNAATLARTGRSVGAAAISVLEVARRPMHGLSEIVPELEAAGYRVSRGGLTTTLLRTGRIVRVGRGIYALREDGQCAQGA